MNVDGIFTVIGIVASVTLPFFNIPLIHKVIKRKSSKDLSLVWVVGVWTCILFMVPASISSTDIVLKVFGIVNFVFFSAVLFFVLKYR